MISLNWVCRRILKSVGYTLRIVEGIGRSISNTGSHNESFDTESADELTVANTVFIGLDIALVPGQAKRPIRHLDDEQVVARVRGQTRRFDLHDLIDLFVFYRHGRHCVWR